MQLHANAELRLKRRRRMVEDVVDRGLTVTQAAAVAGVPGKTCRKWVGRYPG